MIVELRGNVSFSPVFRLAAPGWETKVVNNWHSLEADALEIDWETGNVFRQSKDPASSLLLPLKLEVFWQSVAAFVVRWRLQRRREASRVPAPETADEASAHPVKEQPVAPAADDGEPRRSRFDYNESDASLVEEILLGVKSGRFRSDWEGCVNLAPQAKGSKKGDSKAHRLNRKVKKARPSWIPTSSDSTDPS